MKTRAFRAYQALLFAGIGLLLLLRVWDGKILWYINQRFVLLVFAAGICLMVLAQVAFNAGQPNQAAHSEHEDHQHGPQNLRSLWWLVLPVAIGFLLPAKPLGTTALNTRGMNTTAPLTMNLQDAQQALQINPADRSILDWVRLFSAASSHSAYDGDTVDVTGFVFHDPRLDGSVFMVGRYSITCCVADAYAIGIAVRPQQTVAFADGAWVRVQGRMSHMNLEGTAILLIEAENIQAVPQPEQPYLFP